MKILMLVNWKVEKYNIKPTNKLSADYILDNEKYWFFKYISVVDKVDIIDISSPKFISFFEKKLHFYFWQGFKALFRYKKYDMVICHGMPSAILFSFFKKLFKLKTKLIVFDIGCFNSGIEKGIKFKMMKYPSKSIDGLIYHASFQLDYYKRNFPWIVDKSKFVLFGADYNYFNNIKYTNNYKNEYGKYMLCIGPRDLKTLIPAYLKSNVETKLLICGAKEKIEVDNKNIIYIDKVPIDYLSFLIKESEFGVLPLLPLKFSYGQMTLLQQMALGKCVITSDVSCVSDYVKNNETALVCKSQDIESLSKTIIFACEHKNEITQIGNNAKIYVKDDYNEISMAHVVGDFIINI